MIGIRIIEVSRIDDFSMEEGGIHDQEFAAWANVCDFDRQEKEHPREDKKTHEGRALFFQQAALLTIIAQVSVRINDPVLKEMLVTGIAEQAKLFAEQSALLENCLEENDYLQKMLKK